MMWLFSITKKETNSDGSQGHAGDEDGEDTDDDKGHLIAPAVCPEGPCTVLAEDAASASCSTVKNIDIFSYFFIPLGIFLLF